MTDRKEQRSWGMTDAEWIRELEVAIRDTLEQIKKLEQQARDISGWLSEAGIGPCSIPEGVRQLLQRSDAFRDEVEALRAGLHAYGSHYTNCPASQSLELACTCGYAEMLKDPPAHDRT